MSSNTSVAWVIGLGIVGAAFVAWVAHADTRAVAGCVSEYDGAHEIDCLYTLIDERMRERNITEAMRLFHVAYDGSEVFASTGCHTHAHRVGDMAYYNIYLAERDLDALDLGAETGACGYGFYHGLFEHLVQENRTPEYVAQVCAAMSSRLSSVLADISDICYHGSGHGFMLGYVEDLPESSWGDVSAFVEEPLSLCARLESTTVRGRQECEEGVFNVIVEWMETRQFGFSYDDADPFGACGGFEAGHKRSCYYEMAQKLDRPAAASPVRLSALLATETDEQLRRLAFRVAVAGMVQHVAHGDEYWPILEECFVLDDEYYRQSCLVSVVNGLFEHGLPGEEYRKPLAICADPRVGSAGFVAECHRAVAARMLRFYDAERRAGICREFPGDYREMCSSLR